MKEILSGELVTLWQVRLTTSLLGIYQSQPEAARAAHAQELLGSPATTQSFQAFKQTLSNGSCQYWQIEKLSKVEVSIRERALAKLTTEEKEALGLNG
jgi:hypothetical protein